MGLRAVFREALPDIFDAAGEDATFTQVKGQPVPCKIFIDFDVKFQSSAMNAQVWETGVAIEVLLSEIGVEPDRGDVFTFEETDYTVDSILANDGLTVKVIVT
jgi:hypothetical protein